MPEHKTPLIDELEKGPWPSFVTEIKKAATTSEMSQDLLGQLEYSYAQKKGFWKHGGIVGVMGYGGGVIGRYSAVSDKFPGGRALPHHPPESALRLVLQHGSPPLPVRPLGTARQRSDNMHGSTGDIVFLGTRTEELEPFFAETSNYGFDLGGSGSDVRTPSCCAGPARCEFACYDTMKACYNITQDYQDELHRPAFPYKFKFKFSGLRRTTAWPPSPVRTARSSACGKTTSSRTTPRPSKRTPMPVMDIQADVVANCPTKCHVLLRRQHADDQQQKLRALHALHQRDAQGPVRPGKVRGATILLSAPRRPIVEGALLSSVLIPFIEID